MRGLAHAVGDVLGHPVDLSHNGGLCAQVGADLDVMARDAYGMRGDGPTVFAQGEPSTNTHHTQTQAQTQTRPQAHIYTG